MTKKPLVLMILDGWGYNPNPNEKNAITEAKPENFERLFRNYPHTYIEASGEAVGLPDGQMGNSEVGHLNLGAGRVVYQPLVEITKDIRDGDFFRKDTLVKAFQKAKESGKSIHLMGLLSDGGVHSHIEHLYGLLEMSKRMDVKNVYIHAFMDGRDTAPTSGLGYVEQLEEMIKKIGVGEIATISGRYYSMDRDTNWDRTKKAYEAITGKIEVTKMTAEEVVKRSYEENITDEFIVPALLLERGKVEKGDTIINFNFRPDRARQITRAFVEKDFSGFEREYLDVKYYCMRQYDAKIDASIIYEDKELSNTLGEVLSKHGLKQLRTAETEKYAHVTFFFNGGKEIEFDGEERELIASPKVATYDLKPEMSANELTQAVLKRLSENKYDVIIMNFANPDMVGHTGKFEATVEAIKVVDSSIAKIVDKVLELDGTVLITADHGNAEKMEDPNTHAPFTAHTSFKVPLILVGNKKGIELNEGKLSDVAPTILEILGIEKPMDMTGKSLIK